MTAALATSGQLTPRWYALDYHHEHARIWSSRCRFEHIFAGRRSGKTEVGGKRKAVQRVFEDFQRICDGWTPRETLRYAFIAPTRPQAKRIYWGDLKSLVPRWAIASTSETELTIVTKWGAELIVASGDRPERIEGVSLRGAVLDEYADQKPQLWEETVLPCLSGRGVEGWAAFLGKPRGRNHAWELRAQALEQIAKSKRDGTEPDWAVYTWPSSDILSPAAIETARRNTDPYTFAQEYEASWENFAGRAYYDFGEATHCYPLTYSKTQDLDICLDFNTSPGVLAVTQEQRRAEYPAGHFDSPVLDSKKWRVGEDFTAVVGEVYIQKNSNTERVIDTFIEGTHDRRGFGDHEGRICYYGDATGGLGGSAKIAGSDWEIVHRKLCAHFGEHRVVNCVKSSNPAERARVNAMNTRLRRGDGVVQLVVDPTQAPHVVQDFEGVVVLDGSSGVIDKPKGTMLTHITDAIGYKVETEWPLRSAEYEEHGI